MDRILDKELEEKEKAVEDAIRGALSEQQTITSTASKVNNNNNDNVQPSEDSTIRVLDDEEYLKVDASPALTALLDNALYKTYEAELVPTVSSASQLLTEFINMKQTSALILRECQWMVGVPLSGGMSIYKYNYDQHKEDIAVGSAVLNGVFLGEGAFINKKGEPHVKGTKIGNESMHTTEISNWNEYIVIQDFATQCYAAANEGIQKLSTDRLAESANLTLLDSLNVGNHDGGGESGSSGGGGSHDTPTKSSPSNAASPAPLNLHNDTSSSSSSSYTTLADAGIGRCNHIQPRKNDCWESSRLYCPDYYWADETIGHCQRLLKSLSKHRFVTLVNSTHNGWDRYMNIKTPRKNKLPQGMGYTITAPTYASCTPHVFPSLEAIHALQYLVCELLPTSIPACLNKFRAGVEANAVVSKRLYLVKCEYRAPMRALWESYMNLNAAPKVGMVKGYLHDYHGMKNIWDKNSKGSKSDSSGGGNNSNNDGGGGSSSLDKDKGKGSSGLRRQKSTDGKNKPDAKKPTLKQKREELEVSRYDSMVSPYSSLVHSSNIIL